VTNKVVIALVILAIVALLLIFNKGDVDINLIVTKVSPLKSLAFLIFTAVGVAVGLLLKG
jgi:hypothetical protein